MPATSRFMLAMPNALASSVNNDDSRKISRVPLLKDCVVRGGRLTKKVKPKPTTRASSSTRRRNDQNTLLHRAPTHDLKQLPLDRFMLDMPQSSASVSAIAAKSSASGCRESDFASEPLPCEKPGRLDLDQSLSSSLASSTTTPSSEDVELIALDNFDPLEHNAYLKEVTNSFVNANGGDRWLALGNT